MAERRRGLGRGLGALIPSAPVEAPSEAEAAPQSSMSKSTQFPQSSVSRETVAADESSGAVSEVYDEQVTDKAGDSAPARPAVEVPGAGAEDTAATDVKSAKRGTAGSKKAKKQAPAPLKTSESSAHADSRGASDDTSDNVSRETVKPKRRVISAEARQKAMKARMDLGVSSRSSAAIRPSDMFFTPGPSDDGDAGETIAEDSPSPLTSTSEKSSDDAPQADVVSRGTPGAEVDTNVTDTPQDVAVAKSPSEDATSESRTDSPNSAALQLVPGATFAELNVQDIHPNRKQPRQVFDEDELAELAYSIGELGVLQPVVVRVSRETEGPAYELVMGERRWRATQRAGLETIPAIVRETSDDDLLRDALLENLHRSQLNPLEEAAAYQQLLEEFGASQEELSRRIGRSRPQISNTLRLLRLPALVQRRVAAGVLSAGHARALLSLEDPAEMERLAQRIVAEGLSVRATEDAVTLSKGRKSTVRRSAATQERHRERLDYIADAFSDKLDTSVKINLGARKGRMMIEFASVEDLNRIISVLDPQGLPESQD